MIIVPSTPTRIDVIIHFISTRVMIKICCIHSGHVIVPVHREVMQQTSFACFAGFDDIMELTAGILNIHCEYSLWMILNIQFFVSIIYG